MKPLAIDLFCGLGGWTDGLLAEGYRVQGFDIERHEYGDEKYPAELILADVLELHGSRFADAALIVASPPCQEYSYMAMPWTRAKDKAAAIRADTTGAEMERLNRLFNACFRIQREASEAAGHHIPMVVENVRGAIPWVGRSRWNFGSFHLWGDVPALMPITLGRTALKRGVTHRGDGSTNFHGHSSGTKAPGVGSWRHPSHPDHRPGLDFTRLAGLSHDDGTKQGGDWFAEARKGGKGGTSASLSSKSSARKAASARIAKIPLTLSRWIAATYRPADCAPPSTGIGWAGESSGADAEPSPCSTGNGGRPT